MLTKGNPVHLNGSPWVVSGIHIPSDYLGYIKGDNLEFMNFNGNEKNLQLL
jgi:hypothetical protein